MGTDLKQVLKNPISKWSQITARVRDQRILWIDPPVSDPSSAGLPGFEIILNTILYVTNFGAPNIGALAATQSSPLNPPLRVYALS